MAKICTNVKCGDMLEQELQHQWDVIRKGAVELLPEDEFLGRLKKSIETNTPLRIKQGFDPTAPDIHLGHTVGLRKLRQFQDLGHQVILIIGDYTGLAVGADNTFHAFWTDSNNQQTVVWFYGFEFVPTLINQEDVVTASGNY